MERVAHFVRSISKPQPRTHVASSWKKIVWLFAIMSVAGLIGETIQHFVAFDEWESRPGLIWGPFSPIYGLAAVLLTVALEPLSGKHAWLQFLVAMFIGGGLEYIAAWAMETFWGVVAWSYINEPFNIHGRICLGQTVIWGLLGLLWVRVGIPLTDKIFNKIDIENRTFHWLTVLLTVYLVLNIITTVIVLIRADERAEGVPPANAIELIVDQVYPSDQLQDRFENMGGLGQ